MQREAVRQAVNPNPEASLRAKGLLSNPIAKQSNKNQTSAIPSFHLQIPRSNNYATHKTQKVANWLRSRPRYHLHFTPTSASWINQVERWFAKITDERIRRESFRSVPHLIQTITSYIAEINRTLPLLP